jgi:hypothetical protein
MKGNIVRIIWVLVLIFAGLVTMATRCEPDPGGWNPTQGGPLDGFHATETYGAEQWFLQLTAEARDQ